MPIRVPGYNRTGALVIGLLQILIAIALMGLQVPMYTEELLLAGASVGLSTAVFIICGLLSVCSWNQSTRCLIMAVMTMDIIAALVAAIGLITSVFMNIIDGIRYHYDLSTKLCLGQVGLCFAEGILAIVGSTLCCASGVCSTQPQQMQVLYVTTGAGATPQQNIMYVAPGTVISTTTTTGQVDPQATAYAAQGPAYPPQGNAYPQGPAFPQEEEKPPPYTIYPDGNKA